jgi:hypothetical protein
MAAVDRLLADHLALTSTDLPDASWRDYFDEEMSPAQAIGAGWEDGAGDLSGIPPELLDEIIA